VLAFRDVQEQRVKLERFEGAWTALITPFAADGTVDWEEFERLVRFQVEQGITGLVPAGTTGESATLDWVEHNAVIDTALRLRDERCFVLAGTGSNSTTEALQGTQHAAKNGAEAALLVDCYYNGPSSLELRREYHAAVAAACRKTLIVPYIIPGRTGTALSPEDLAILAHDCPNVRAVKEATGDLARMAHTRSLVGDAFDILSGDDNLTATMMTDSRIRSSGVVSVISNVVPGAVEAMTRAFLVGHKQEGHRLATALEPLFDMVTVVAADMRRLAGRLLPVKDKFRNPLPIKTLMQGLGMVTHGCRQPLGKMTIIGVETVRVAARRVWEANPEILQPIEDAYGVSMAERLNDDSFWTSLAYGTE
jgi:4-hydroxy-tetrahydrodipicolinate synthase